MILDMVLWYRRALDYYLVTTYIVSAFCKPAKSHLPTSSTKPRVYSCHHRKSQGTTEMSLGVILLMFSINQTAISVLTALFIQVFFFLNNIVMNHFGNLNSRNTILKTMGLPEWLIWFLTSLGVSQCAITEFSYIVCNWCMSTPSPLCSFRKRWFFPCTPRLWS